jgi:hypothetical protein
VRDGVTRLVPEKDRAGVLDRLKRAEAAAGSGRLYLALLELQAPFEMEGGYEVAVANANLKTPEEFARKWKDSGEPAAQLRPDGRPRPIVVDALAASAQARGPATYRASRPYFEDSGAFGGLYYLGESHAVGRFAAFCRALEWPAAGTRPALRSIAPELNAFEASVVKAYESAEGANRQGFIGVNIALKLARELDQRGELPGALLEYLRARYRFSIIGTPDPGADAAPRIQRERQSLAAGVDHSIALLFLELAASNAENQAPPGPRGAAAILDDVLPAYKAVVKP